MAKAELKTQVNDASATNFLNSVAEEQKRNEHVRGGSSGGHSVHDCT